MTTLRTIITRVYREVNIGGTGRRVPKAEEAQDALDAFNAMWRALRGKQIGQRLKRNWTLTAGQTATAGDLLAVNASTPAQPNPGDRLGVIGAITITATDGTIQGAASVTTSGNASWFYREDMADWKLETVLGLDDTQPFADLVEEYLPFMLAARMCGQFGHPLTPLIQTGNDEGMARMRQLYGYKPVVMVDLPLLRGVGKRWLAPSCP